MRSTTQIAPNPNASPITPPGISVFCATQSAANRPNAMDDPDRLAGWEVAAHDLADPDDALERDPAFFAGEFVHDVDDADRIHGDGLLLRQQPVGFDVADDVGDRGDVGAGRLDDRQSSFPVEIEQA
jgi:hypothetical protein